VADRRSYERVLEDLAAEHEELDALVAGLDEEGWDAPTPAPGWAVRDQVGHLAFFDAQARDALADPDSFTSAVAAVMADPVAEARWMDDHLTEARGLAAGELLEWWRAERAALLAALAMADPSARIPWFGPAMGAVSFASARLMETWAHGQDVADALGVTRLPTVRLRHVAHLGVGARPFSFIAHGLEVPAEPVRVELRSPDRETWVWGPAAADDSVQGTALDFCLVVTQRRHLDDAHLEIKGPVATDWMAVAQAFAGPPGEGRKPGQFRSS
jgi:uncharacterized protein (TIGR03084 family)